MKNILYILLTLSAILSFCSCTSPNDMGTELLYKTTEPYETEQRSIDEISTAFSKTDEATERTERQITTIHTTAQTKQSASTSTAPTAQQKPASTTSSDIIVVSNREYKEEQNGMVLSVSLPENIKCGEKFTLVAKITNTTEESITYTLPTSTENSHYDIRIVITDGQNNFIDCEQHFKPHTNLEKAVSLNPNETYTQTVLFMPGWTTDAVALEEADITMFSPGEYNGSAKFNWNSNNGTESITLDFPVIVKESIRGRFYD